MAAPQVFELMNNSSNFLEFSTDCSPIPDLSSALQYSVSLPSIATDNCNSFDNFGIYLTKSEFSEPEHSTPVQPPSSSDRLFKSDPVQYRCAVRCAVTQWCTGGLQS